MSAFSKFFKILFIASLTSSISNEIIQVKNSLGGKKKKAFQEFAGFSFYHCSRCTGNQKGQKYGCYMWRNCMHMGLVCNRRGKAWVTKEDAFWRSVVSVTLHQRTSWVNPALRHSLWIMGSCRGVLLLKRFSKKNIREGSFPFGRVGPGNW